MIYPSHWEEDNSQNQIKSLNVFCVLIILYENNMLIEIVAPEDVRGDR